jgi:hypothetical protein
MSNKKLSFLGILAIASVIAAVFVSQFAHRARPASGGQGNLIQGLDPAAIAEIVIRRGATASQQAGKEQGQISLRRRGEGFAVANKSFYPASNRAINDLLAACLDIRTVELCTENKANYKDLGVTEEDARDVVKFLDSNGKIITGIIIGNPRPDGSMAYGKLLNDDKVYIIYNTPWVKSSPLDYVQQELISANKADIESVTVTSPSGVYTLISEANGTQAALKELPAQGRGLAEGGPAGEKEKKSQCLAVLDALSNLRFDDVNAVSENPNLDFSRQYQCLLKDSTLYTIQIAQPASAEAALRSATQPREAEASADKKDSNTFIKCSADFTDKTPVRKEQAVESEEELKKKEVKLLAKEKAKKFNDTCEGWIYRIPEYEARNMTKPLAELVENIIAESNDANAPKEVKK